MRLFLPGFFRFALLAAIPVMTGCTRPPDVPNLNRRPSAATNAIVLHDSLGPKDLRELFRAINNDGKLDSLATYLEKPSDADLETLSRLVSKYLYREADRDDGLPGAVEEGTRRNDFARFDRWASEWAREKSFDSQVGALYALLDRREFPALARLDVGFLAPEWTSLASRIYQRALSEYHEIRRWPEATPAPTPDMILADMAQFYRRGLSPDLVDTATRLWTADMGTSVAKAARSLRVRFTASGHPGAAFEGFGHGLSAMLTRPAPSPFSGPGTGVTSGKNQLALLLEFNRLADGPSAGLFTHIQEKIHAAPEEFPADLQPILVKSAVGYLLEAFQSAREDDSHFDKAFWCAVAKKDPAAAPADEVIDLSIAVQTAFERVKGAQRGRSAAEEDDGGEPVAEDASDAARKLKLDAFTFDLPLYVDTYVTTRWLQRVAHESRGDWDCEHPESDPEFFRTVWKKPLTLKAPTATERPDWDVTLLETFDDPQKGKIARLTDRAKRDFTALGPDFARLAAKLEGDVVPGDVGSFHVTFPDLPARATFAETLLTLVRRVNGVRPIADLSPVVRSFAYFATHPESSSSFSFGSLETDNLMDTLNRVLGVLPLSTWRSFEGLLFNGLQLNDNDNATRSLLLKFYADKPNMARRVAGLLDSIGMVQQFGKEVEGLPSPLETYRETLAYTRPASDEVHAITNTLSFLSCPSRAIRRALVGAKCGGFVESSGGKPRFPSFYAWVQKGLGIPRLLFGLSLLEPAERAPFFAPLNVALGTEPKATGLELHLKTLEWWLGAERPGLAALIGHWEHADHDFLSSLDSVPASYRAWMVRFIKSGDFASLWEFFHRNGDRSAWLRMVRDLRALQNAGSLNEAFRLLAYVKNDRIQRLAGILREWDESGELARFLSGLDSLLARR